MKQVKKKVNYIDNSEFHAALLEHKTKCIEADKKGIERPRASNFIGDCIMKISYNLTKKSWYSGYSFKDEMMLDGIENGIKAVDNYDPFKYKNPHAYFTMIIMRAFSRRKETERKEREAMHDNLMTMLTVDELNGITNQTVDMVNMANEPRQKELKTDVKSEGLGGGKKKGRSKK